MDPGWVKNQNPDPGSGSGMNNPADNSVSLETIFVVKILTFFDADPGWKIFGSGINIPDPQHCFKRWPTRYVGTRLICRTLVPEEAG
jgi:hypothetical protein